MYLVVWNVEVIIVFEIQLMQTKQEVFVYDAPQDEYLRFLESAREWRQITYNRDFYFLFWTSGSL